MVVDSALVLCLHLFPHVGVLLQIKPLGKVHEDILGVYRARRVCAIDYGQGPPGIPAIWVAANLDSSLSIGEGKWIGHGSGKRP